MASINIGADNAGDAFYRYKMPKLQARVSPPRPQGLGRGASGGRGGLGRRGGGGAVSRVRFITIDRLACRLTARTQIEGRGNGIKTNVVNNVDIAKALERPPECEGGALAAAARCAPPACPLPLPPPPHPHPCAHTCRRAQVVWLRAGRADQL